MIGTTNIKTNLDLDAINKRANEHLYELVRFSEKKYQDEIELIANNIMYSNKKFVLLAGPSSSGKTTTSKKICEQLKSLGINSISISLDDFFVNRDKTPKLADGNYDFENFSILDVEKFNECIKDLIDKQETDLPIFNFITGKREEFYNHIKITDNDVIVIEGIHALNPKLLTIDSNYFYKIYVCVFTNFQINNTTVIPAKLLRLMRRLIRDVQTRGTSIKQTIDTWHHVCEGEEKYIKPYREQANHLIDTTHMYEPLLYHTYLQPLLSKHLDTPYGKELYDKLSKCGYLKQNIIPNDSLLWEFLVKEVNIEDMYN